MPRAKTSRILHAHRLLHCVQTDLIHQYPPRIALELGLLIMLDVHDYLTVRSGNIGKQHTDAWRELYRLGVPLPTEAEIEEATAAKAVFKVTAAASLKHQGHSDSDVIKICYYSGLVAAMTVLQQEGYLPPEAIPDFSHDLQATFVNWLDIVPSIESVANN